MEFKIKMILEGEFPGSPDIDTFQVDEKTWDKVRGLLFKKKR